MEPDVQQVPASGNGSRIAAVVAVVALLLSVLAVMRSGRSVPEAPRAQSTFAEILKTHTIHAGYGGFPPYTIINLNEPDSSKRVTGFCIDLMNEIARRCDPPLRVEWEHFNWKTMRAELDQGRVDVLADIVYATVPRATDMEVTDPFSYVGIACGLVRADENRIRTFKDLERKDITVALAQGWASSEYAFQNLSRPRTDYLMIPAGDDAAPQLDAVINGRADIALNDVPSVAQYVKNHPGKVKGLWLDEPPSLVGGGFATRRQDTELLAFLNQAIHVLEVDGTIRRLDEKWKTYGHFERLNLTQGEGLKSR